MLIFKKLTLKIHCWGGLGSQLLALNYYLRIAEKFPNKRVVLVLHTGGITARNSEIDFLSSKVNMLKVDDFYDNFDKKIIQNRRFVSLKTLLKTLIKFLGDYFKFIITDDNKVYLIRPWTYSVRCTYTSNVLRKQEVVRMANILGIDSNSSEQSFLGIHYRMGDLPTLKPSALVPLDSISKIINDLNKAGAVVDTVRIYSDSIVENSNLQLHKEINSEWKSVDTLQTISELSRSKYFIGTSSKVSLWVAIFRWALNTAGDVYLPSSIMNQFDQLTNIDRSSSVQIKSYS